MARPVAVIIPVYNRPQKLIKTLKTVAAQTELPELVIVVDDGSSDRTADMAQRWLAANASFEWRVVRQANMGVSVARNTGFGQIGDLPYVCFLDSDDLWPSDFIEKSIRALQAPGEPVAAFANRLRERAGRRKQTDLRPIVVNPLLWLLFNGGALLSCTMIRSSAARAAGLFDPRMRVRQDMHFFIRLLSLGAAAYSDANPVVCIRGAELDPTEPPNNSDPSLDFKYGGAVDLTRSLSKIPSTFLSEHDHSIRTAVARRWALVAFSCRKARRFDLAIDCLLRAVWWDHDWSRRGQLIFHLLRGQERVLERFPNPFENTNSSWTTNSSD